MPGNRPQWWSRCQRRQAASRFDSMRVFFRQELLSPEALFCPRFRGETITTTAMTGQVRSLEWTGNRLRVLDQRLLPTRVEYVELERWHDVVTAIPVDAGPRRAGHRCCGSVRCRAGRASAVRLRRPRLPRGACGGCRATRSGAPDGSEPPLGPSPAPSAPQTPPPTRPTPSSVRCERHRLLKQRTSRRTWPSARTVRRCYRRARECLRTATPALWPPPDTAPRSA